MPNYDLNQLGHQEFEHLIQTLLKEIIGAGTITFGQGADGGREATYDGKAPYPSTSEQWDGSWIFQAKFHDLRQMGSDKARNEVLRDLRSELEKIVSKYKRKCQNYILATNVPLTSVSGSGTHDKIAQEIVPDFLKSVPHIHVWGYDDVCRFLEKYPNIRRSYLHLITPGDLVAQLMERNDAPKTALADTIRLYVSTSQERDQFAQLDQAGEINDKPLPLRDVFIDLDLRTPDDKDIEPFPDRVRDTLRRRPQPLSAMQLLVSADIPKIVLLGGPGQGKSTLSQFLAQTHGAYLLKKDNSDFVPSVVRVPFRISLKDYAQWLTDTHFPKAVENYLATVVEERAARQVTAEQIQDIIKQNPVLLILDGLDEVTGETLREQMLGFLREFINRCEDALHGDLQIVATSRPVGYAEQFDPSRFLHLVLAPMSSKRVLEYTTKWISAKVQDVAKGKSLQSSMEDCIKDPNFAPLMVTPLQATIFILIILSGGTPPRQREELFNEYLEVIYKRERAKSKTVIQTEKRLLFGLHAYMGYILHRNATEASETRSRLTETDFSNAVLSYLRSQDPFTSIGEIQARADQLIKEAHERLVLLVKLEPGFFGFELRSLQEFFAAGYLVDTASGDKQRFARFDAIALPPHWRNVALFFAGRVSRCHPGEASQVLESCRELDRRLPDKLLRRGAWLALDIALDRSFGPNKVLQSAAIEYALTLLDDGLPGRDSETLISRLRALPVGDVQQFVIPELISRLERLHVPECFTAMNVYQALGSDTVPLEKAVDLALTRDQVSRRQLLRRAIALQAAPQFIKERFAQDCVNLTEDLVSDLFLTLFVARPQYTAAVLEALGITDKALISLLCSAMDTAGSAGIIRQRPGERATFNKRSSDLDTTASQICYAWQLFADARIARTELDWHLRRDYFGFRSVMWDFPLGYGVFSPRRLFNFPHYLHEALLSVPPEGLVLDSSKNLALRGAALAFLRFGSLFAQPQPSGFRALFGRSGALLGRSGSDKVFSKFLRHASRDDLEIVENMLFRFQVPSLETQERFPDDYFRPPKLPNDPDPEDLPVALVLDPFSQEQCEEILLSSGRSGKSKGLMIRELRIVIRTFGQQLLASATAHGHTPALRGAFVDATLRQILSVLTTNAIAEWRTWAALTRLGIPRWADTNDPGLKVTLAKLCDAFEQKMSQLSGRWELCGIVTRSVAIPQLKDITLRLLAIIGRMGDGRLCDRDARAPVDSPEPHVIVTLSELASQSEEPVLIGFLKWLACTTRQGQAGSSFRRSEVPPLGLDAGRVRFVLENTDGMAREGALLASGELSLRETISILKLSVTATEAADHAWAELLQRSLDIKDDSEVSAALEQILSKGFAYSRVVTQTALNEYERRRKTPDIREQEIPLGLPLARPV